MVGKVNGGWWGTGNDGRTRTEPNQVDQAPGTLDTGQQPAALARSVATNTGNESSHRGQANIEHLYPWPIGRVTATI